MSESKVTRQAIIDLIQGINDEGLLNAIYSQLLEKIPTHVLHNLIIQQIIPEMPTDLINIISDYMMGLEFTYEHDFDQNGILYYLGTQNGEDVKWVNPATTGKVTCAMVSGGYGAGCVGNYREWIAREATHVHTREGDNRWFSIDLKQNRCKPTDYTIRSYPKGAGACPVSWVLEAKASGDSAKWDVLSSHANTRDIATMGASRTYPLRTDQFYSIFRIRSTGIDAKGTRYLCVSGFELYGELIDTDLERKASMYSDLELPSALNYSSDFDQNGLLYYLGTRGRGVDSKAPWQNPASCGLVVCSMVNSGSGAGCVGNVDDWVSRTGAHVHTREGDNRWFELDLLELTLRPTDYTIRSYPKGGGACPVSWVLEAKASGDSAKWDVLSSHANTRDIATMGASRTYPLRTDQFYSIFRIRSTGIDAKGTRYLCVSGFELYGTPKVADNDRRKDR